MTQNVTSIKKVDWKWMEPKRILSQHLSSKTQYLSHDWFPLHFFKKANPMVKWIFYADLRQARKQKTNIGVVELGSLGFFYLVRSQMKRIHFGRLFCIQLIVLVEFFSLIIAGQWAEGSKRRITTIVIISPFSGLLKPNFAAWTHLRALLCALRSF